ncbi:MAG: hypothetical protein E4H26_06430 [Flavobacteriales bacterium]|nr:MAG: hypothetical protein E4H26_06430 [Flavobacteriales bacterium]
MNRLFTFLACFFFFGQLQSQEIDRDLLAIKSRLDSIDHYEASISLDVLASFIKMPTKYATITYDKDQPVSFTSDNFILIPKRGLDFTLTQLFQYPFITLDRGIEKRQDNSYKVINVIPDDDHAEYTIAKILLDTTNLRIVESEINTRNEGSFRLQLFYNGSQSALPDRVEITFELQKLRLPFNFFGKDTQIDRQELRSLEEKKGTIILRLTDYVISTTAIKK